MSSLPRLAVTWPVKKFRLHRAKQWNLPCSRIPRWRLLTFSCKSCVSYLITAGPGRCFLGLGTLCSVLRLEQPLGTGKSVAIVNNSRGIAMISSTREHWIMYLTMKEIQGPLFLSLSLFRVGLSHCCCHQYSTLMTLTPAYMPTISVNKCYGVYSCQDTR
jgi:hypothetical protein